MLNGTVATDSAVEALLSHPTSFVAAALRTGASSLGTIPLTDEVVARIAEELEKATGAQEWTLEHLRDHETRHRHRHVLLDLSQPILDLEQILAPDVLHRDEVRTVDAAELEDLADVRVRELAGDLRFIDEHLDEVAVLAHRRQDPLDGDHLLEAFDAIALGLEDLGHAADADAIEQQVFPERDRLAHASPMLSLNGA